MKILIIENEIYLAQSISTKLHQFGFECEIIPLVEDAMNAKADIILLSVGTSRQNIYPLIEKFKEAIIILMIPYINNETVERPLKAGAKDYIIKPFIIDELVRKIEHYNTFSQLQKEVAFYKDYLAHSFCNASYAFEGKLSFPLIVKSTSQKVIDIYVANYAIQKKLPINLIKLHKNTHYKESLQNISKQQLTYVTGLETLKKEERLECVKSLRNIPVIFSCLGGEVSDFPNVYEISLKNISTELQDDVLSVDEYIHTMILKFEDRYPDTELSKRLGMSRKSLWEKRKKYGITKKK
ncbi:MAG: response regulator [Helicobacter sp.]|nr:response regulator [Helicobacter sp.]